jgi:uncharacterized protein YciI
MQFIVTAYDGTDEGALQRRMNAREDHLKLTARMQEEGKTLYAVAILDESGKMIGSMLIVDFPSRAELDKWLEVEPYIKGDVWKIVDVKPCKVGPMFMELHK